MKEMQLVKSLDYSWQSTISFGSRGLFLNFLEHWDCAKSPQCGQHATSTSSIIKDEFAKGLLVIVQRELDMVFVI